MTVLVTSPAALGPVAPSAPRFPVGRRLARQRRTIIAATFVAALAALCYLGSQFLPDPDRIDLNAMYSAPSLRHPFGTDESGRDELARVLRGGQISLAVATGVAALATAVGTAVGLAAGFRRGRVDELLMRIVDVVLVVPVIVAALLLSSVTHLGPVGMTGTLRTVLILALCMWAPVARVMRAGVCELREAAFVEAARSAGASDGRIVVRHILPNLVGSILVAATLVAVSAILAESALSFLGFGVAPPAASWGSLLKAHAADVELYPWLSIFPGLAIFLTALAVNLLGDGLRDAFDVKVLNRR